MLKITDGKSWKSRQTSEEISGQMAQNVKLCLALRPALRGRGRVNNISEWSYR